jgi:hypothetical protein
MTVRTPPGSTAPTTPPGTGSAYIARTFTTTGAAGAPTLTFNYTLDNGTPTNPNDDILITALHGRHLRRLRLR